MNDFKRNDRFGGKKFGGKPSFQRPGGGFGRPQGQMHQATCAQCGKACEVPFRPDGSRPIYCRDCFRGIEDSAPSRPSRSAPERPYHSAPRFQTPEQPRFHTSVQPVTVSDPRIDDVLRQMTKIQLKLDKILLELAVNEAQASIEVIQAAKKKISKKK